MIQTYSSLDMYAGQHVWIYNWSAAREQFYCIPVLKGDRENGIARDPIAVNLSPNFSAKYNHLVIVTYHPQKCRQRLALISENIEFTTKVCSDKEGYLIMKQLTAREIADNRNKGTAILVYAQRARELYELLRINYYFFYIESMGNYENVVQCYFNHMRASLSSFGSRGLFEIITVSSSSDVEDTLRFVSEDVDEHFPPYKITAFDIEAARFDDKFPIGNTLLDRLCTVAFQTVTVKSASRPRDYYFDNDHTAVIFVYLPTKKYSESMKPNNNVKIIRCATERELVQRVLAYISLANAVFITGWNIMKYDYRFLFNRAVYHNSVPNFISEYTFSRMCGMTDVFDLAPPWKLSIDTMECRKQFYPRHLKVNPPSNSIDATAKALLPAGMSKVSSMKITRINKVYWKLENNTDMDDTDVELFLKQLVTYNVRDVQLVTDLNGVLQVVQTLVPLSALADLNPGDCINYNATKVCLTYMKNQFQSVLMAPIDYNVIYNRGNYGLLYRKTGKYSVSGGRADLGKKGTYKGATVLDPEIGVHTNNNNNKTLACFDFASLYPSIMRTFAIIRGFVTRLSVDEYEADKSFYETRFKPLFIPADPDNVYLSVRNCVSSPIQYLCASLIEKRKANKTKAPTVAAALKILTNSTYGLCGVKGVLYDEVAVSMITAYGREFLLDVMSYFKEMYPGLKVLYGDTDSVFVSFEAGGSSAEMVARYNRYLEEKNPIVNALQLAVEDEFQCIIFIRKKLYMAKSSTKPDKYKLSGFPQRVNPKIHASMTKALGEILEIAIRSPLQELPGLLEQFYRDLFESHTCQTNDEGDYFFNLKVKSLDSYKSRTGKNYHVGSMYEKSTGIKIQDDDVAYVSICEVVPLVRKLPRKSFSLCLERDYDSRLYCMNRSASLTEFLSKTFDPILLAIVDDKSNTTMTLKSMSAEYVESLQKESLLKHVTDGYAVFDYSDCAVVSSLKISTAESWPEFYVQFVSNREMRSASDKIPWILEDYSKEERKNVRLSIEIIGGEKEERCYATLCHGPRPLFSYGFKRKFYSLDELGKLIRELLLGGKEDSRFLLSKIFVSISNPLTKKSSLKDILDFLNFIYGDTKKKCTGEKFVILLPFITIKSKKQRDDDEEEENDNSTMLQFCYY